MRLIDADALPIKFDGHIVSVWKNDIDNAPTVDAVPVVRCKDCKHSCHKNVYGVDCTFCNYGVCLACEVEDDFFCAEGERREDD